MNSIPWWAIIVAKIILSRFPVSNYTWQRIGLFRHGRMDESSYLRRVFDFHVNRSGLSGKLGGKLILELGPGDSIASALLAACYGARCILIDAGAFASNDISTYHRLAIQLKSDGLTLPPSFMDTSNVYEVVEACRATYLTEGTSSLQALDSNKVDFIFSQAVLEHIRLREFNSFIGETHRVLKVGGVSSHQIDLKDHLGGGLNNLRINEKLWESSFFSRSGFYTNRLGYSDIIKVFEEIDFETNVSGVDQWDQPPLAIASMAQCFKSRSIHDLKIKQFDVLARKN
jgi:SAM-dependent methyltransferase